MANTLSLLDAYADFEEWESEHFRLLIHRDESAVLGSVMLREAERAYAAYRDRYPYRLTGKIQIEAYNDPDDFAVRVAGIPHIGLLGSQFWRRDSPEHAPGHSRAGPTIGRGPCGMRLRTRWPLGLRDTMCRAG